MEITVVNTISLGDIVSDVILFLTFLALVWYSLETRALRQWQKKQVQSNLLSMDIQRVINNVEHPGVRIPYGKPWPVIMQEIYELGTFNIKDLYSSVYHQPPTFSKKSWDKIKSFLKNKLIG